MSFKQFLQNENILSFLKDQKISTMTPIQNEAIPAILKGGTSIIQSKTGSGKTFAYLLPIISLLKEMETMEKKGPTQKGPKAVIILPTRELALQIFSVAKGISHFAKLRIRKIVGGDKGKPLQDVFKTDMDILIATPDRLLRAIEKKEVSTQNMKYLVLDEADQLFDNSFKNTILKLNSFFPLKKIDIYLVSASKPDEYDKIVNYYFPEITFNVIGKDEENLIDHKIKIHNFSVEEEQKLLYLEDFIKKINQSNGIIFTGNRSRAVKVYEAAKKYGHPKVFLVHKEMTKEERLKTMDEFTKKGGIIVATDILARGMDIPHLNWILNFDLPSHAEYYLHRSGRVGRANRSGDVFNFISSKDGFRKKRINESLKTQKRNDLTLLEVKSFKEKTQKKETVSTRSTRRPSEKTTRNPHAKISKGSRNKPYSSTKKRR